MVRLSRRCRCYICSKHEERIAQAVLVDAICWLSKNVFYSSTGVVLDNVGLGIVAVDRMFLLSQTFLNHRLPYIGCRFDVRG